MNTVLQWQEPVRVHTDEKGWARIPSSGALGSVVFHIGAMRAFFCGFEGDAISIKITDENGQPLADSEADVRVAVVR